MVMNYADIYASIEAKLNKQDWYTDEWNSNLEEDAVRVFKEEWIGEDGLELYFESYGQGDDPEQNPIILSIKFGESLDEISNKMEMLENRIQEELKPLIGWKPVMDENTFVRKELPSDPLTLQPRLLEEFKKLDSIAFRIDQMLDYAPDPNNEENKVEDESSAQAG